MQHPSLPRGSAQIDPSRIPEGPVAHGLSQASRGVSTRENEFHNSTCRVLSVHSPQSNLQVLLLASVPRVSVFHAPRPAAVLPLARCHLMLCFLCYLARAPCCDKRKARDSQSPRSLSPKPHLESRRSWQLLRAPSNGRAPSSESQRTRSEVIEARAVDALQRSQQPSSPVAAAV